MRWWWFVGPAFLVQTSAIPAQDVPADCTYETCALRVEPGGWFSSAKLVRGAGAIEIGGRGPSPTLEALLAGNDSAMAHYEDLVVADRRADRSTIVAVMLSGASLAVYVVGDREWNGWSAGLMAGYFGIAIPTAIVRNRASRSLSRALWWYNGSLPRIRSTSGPGRTR